MHQINFKIEKAGDFILIFVICLINLRKHFSVVPLYALFHQHVSIQEKMPFFFSTFCLSSKHGVPSVPALLEHCVMSFFFFYTAEYQFVLRMPVSSRRQ